MEQESRRHHGSLRTSDGDRDRSRRRDCSRDRTRDRSRDRRHRDRSRERVRRNRSRDRSRSRSRDRRPRDHSRDPTGGQDHRRSRNARAQYPPVEQVYRGSQDPVALQNNQPVGQCYETGRGHNPGGRNSQAGPNHRGGHPCRLYGDTQLLPRNGNSQMDTDSPSPPVPAIPKREENASAFEKSRAPAGVSGGGGQAEPGAMGRGRGRGRGGGGRGAGRGAARRERREEEFDLVVTRPAGISKRAPIVNGNKAVRLQGNFFKVTCQPNWQIYHYRVDFLPDEADTRIKKGLLRAHGMVLGAYIFDGSSLYVSQPLRPNQMRLESSLGEEKIEITIRLVATLAPTDVMYLQFFNIIVRKCLEGMALEEVGRHFYDRHQAVRLEAHKLELWPGYKTSMRNHEHNILLGVEITHKVLRIDNCLHVINNMRGRLDQERIKETLVGNIVMTQYNRKTYRIDDIDWNTTPSSTFEMRGTQKTFLQYFHEKYGVPIRDPRQPMLVSRPKKRDFHRGMTGPILLIPELCQMTGLTDEMRANNNLMRALATHLHTDPTRRIQRLQDFMSRLRSQQPIQEELSRWGLGFENQLVAFDGHVIPKENILFGGGQHEVPNERYDWGQAFRTKPLLSSVPLKTWAVIVPSRDAHVVEKLVGTIQRVGRPLQFPISAPIEIRRVPETKPNDYATAVDRLINEYRDRMQLIFAILPRQETDIYSAVKKRACIEFGVPSQCFVAKNAHNEKGIMSICTKLVVQMSAKIGGEPWAVRIPLAKLMIVGFDVYHCGKRKGASYGAMVATTSQTHAKYFSTVSKHGNKDDLSEKMGADFTKCLHAYQKVNQDLPDRIIMYRDGVGDGQLKYVYETELKEIQKCMTAVYIAAGREVPKLSFIVVTKKINTRIFAHERGRPFNPGPGTVADDVITLPERYDFYLVSQHSRQGTVSPVSYHVLYDRQGLDADKMQRLTFKLCHLYFNWSGTVTVPAPCQYAGKLAFLVGSALGGPSHERLSNLLYYL